MKKIIFIFLFLLSQCGYQPIHLNKNFSINEFSKISFEGNDEINNKIISSLSFKENNLNDNLEKLFVKSSYKIIETKKSSSGEVQSYKSKIEFYFLIKNQDKKIKEKNFQKELSYNSKENKFDLVQYQNKIKNELDNKIIEDIILYLNI